MTEPLRNRPFRFSSPLKGEKARRSRKPGGAKSAGDGIPNPTHRCVGSKMLNHGETFLSPLGNNNRIYREVPRHPSRIQENLARVRRSSRSGPVAFTSVGNDIAPGQAEQPTALVKRLAWPSVLNYHTLGNSRHIHTRIEGE